MKIQIALANQATAGEINLVSLSASRLESSKAKIERLNALIEKTKSNAAYKTSEKLKASVKRRTALVKELNAKVKELSKSAPVRVKASPAKATKNKRIGDLPESHHQFANNLHPDDAQEFANMKKSDRTRMVKHQIKNNTRFKDAFAEMHPGNKVAPVKKRAEKVDTVKRAATLQKRIDTMDANAKKGVVMTENMIIRRAAMRGELKDMKAGKTAPHHPAFPNRKSEDAYHGAMDKADKEKKAKQSGHASKAKGAFFGLSAKDKSKVVSLIKKGHKTKNDKEAKPHLDEIKSMLGVRSLGANPWSTLNGIHLIGH